MLKLVQKRAILLSVDNNVMFRGHQSPPDQGRRLAETAGDGGKKSWTDRKLYGKMLFPEIPRNQ